VNGYRWQRDTAGHQRVGFSIVLGRLAADGRRGPLVMASVWRAFDDAHPTCASSASSRIGPGAICHPTPPAPAVAPKRCKGPTWGTASYTATLLHHHHCHYHHHHHNHPPCTRATRGTMPLCRALHPQRRPRSPSSAPASRCSASPT
jgi:hypothetical protein